MDGYFTKFLGMQPYFEISDMEWEYIKNTYPKEFVREQLAEVLMTYPLPYAEIAQGEAEDDYKKLKGVRWNEILKTGEWFSRKADSVQHQLTYCDEYQYFGRLNVGNSSSNYFQQENRWSADSEVSPGPKKTWENKKFMISLMGSAYSLKMPKLGRRELRTMIGLRKYICAQFKPNVAKAFYDMFGAKTVLDFSMGWGDRLAGAFASEHVEHYVGLDPRKENHPIYQQQRDFYQKHTTLFEIPTRTDFHCCPAEDFDYSEYPGYFDVVFTSPPYFSAERYSYDDSQSWIRYSDIDSWNTNFLHATLKKIIPSVKPDGIIAINISDVYNRKSNGWVEICNPMIEFLISEGMHYRGAIGMEMAKRPNSGGASTALETGIHNWTEKTKNEMLQNQNKVFCEPIWIFQK